MKLNNKGFAITTILYGTLILFMLLFATMLGFLSIYKSRLNILINETNGIRDNLLRNITTDFDFTEDKQEFRTPISGYYKLETWGAQGGDFESTYYGGYGAYSTGIIYLELGEVLYIYVGGKGKSSCNSSVCDGGYNGGGSANQGGSGGGATHIATALGTLKEVDLNNVLVVSGGGGGASNLGDSDGNGGSGGGMLGNDGLDSKCSNKYGRGGTQNLSENCIDLKYCQSGTYGQGGNWFGAINGGAGGGGYYGGGSGTGGNCYGGGGGGSGYIANNSLTNKHMTCYNCTPSTSELTKTNTTINVSSEPVSDYAKIGNGYARITYIGNTL